MQKVLEDEPGGALAARSKVHGLLGMDPLRNAQCGYMVHFQDRPIGFVHVLSINWISRTCEIDIMVEPTSQRSLLGVWVLAKTGEICFDVLNLRKAYGYIFAHNLRSSRFFSRLMPVEATLVAGRRSRSGDEDVLVASLTVDSYRQLRNRYKWDDFIKGRGGTP